jgi:hypothetical protein
MVFSRRARVSMVLLMLSSAASADRQDMDRLLALSGDTALASMAHGRVLEVDDAVKAKLGEALAAKLQLRLEAASTSALFQDAAATALEKKRDEAALKASFAFFQSPLFQRIQKAEEASETDAGQKEFEAFMERIEEQKISKAREALVNDLVIKTGLLAEVLAVFAQALEVQMRSANTLLPANKAWSDKGIAEAVAANRKEMGSQMQMYLTANLLYTYKGIKDAELKQYVDFLLSKGGQWYKSGLLAGIGAGYQTVVKKAATGK